MNNEIQNSEFILPGNLGEVKTSSGCCEIKKVEKRRNGSTTLTISPPLIRGLFHVKEEKTYDAEFEVIEPLKIENK